MRKMATAPQQSAQHPGLFGLGNNPGAPGGGGGDRPPNPNDPPRGHYADGREDAILHAMKEAGIYPDQTLCLACGEVADEAHRRNWRRCPGPCPCGEDHTSEPCPLLLKHGNSQWWVKRTGLTMEREAAPFRNAKRATLASRRNERQHYQDPRQYDRRFDNRKYPDPSRNPGPPSGYYMPRDDPRGYDPYRYPPASHPRDYPRDRYPHEYGQYRSRTPPEYYQQRSSSSSHRWDSSFPAYRDQSRGRSGYDRRNTSRMNRSRNPGRAQTEARPVINAHQRLQQIRGGPAPVPALPAAQAAVVLPETLANIERTNTQVAALYQALNVLTEGRIDTALAQLVNQQQRTVGNNAQVPLPGVIAPQAQAPLPGPIAPQPQDDVVQGLLNRPFGPAQGLPGDNRQPQGVDVVQELLNRPMAPAAAEYSAESQSRAQAINNTYQGPTSLRSSIHAPVPGRGMVNNDPISNPPVTEAQQQAGLDTGGQPKPEAQQPAGSQANNPPQTGAQPTTGSQSGTPAPGPVAPPMVIFGAGGSGSVTDDAFARSFNTDGITLPPPRPNRNQQGHGGARGGGGTG